MTASTQKRYTPLSVAIHASPVLRALRAAARNAAEKLEQDGVEDAERLGDELLILAETVFGMATNSLEASIEPTTVRDLKAYQQQMRKILESDIDELSPTQYIRADRFLRRVDTAIAALQDPNVSKYLGVGKGKIGNVAELIDYMSHQGLGFAPAVPGDEAAYTALYHALRAFDAGVKK